VFKQGDLLKIKEENKVKYSSNYYIGVVVSVLYVPVFNKDYVICWQCGEVGTYNSAIIEAGWKNHE